ncbi:MAG TPA: MBOAT family O-acyltransferase [Polyangiaceae bacterium]|nr:MBOAT family O-acyltransferase [Polyangiaceae bacterium]
MIFTQPIFFAFFALTFGVHFALRGERARKLWLLAASYVFYGYWDYRFVGLIVLCTLVDYSVGLLLGRTEDKRRRHALIAASLCMNLGLLGFFKYYGFFVSSAVDLLTSLGFHASVPVLKVVLPAGISFFTFQTMSYTIDVYRRQLEPQRNLLDFAVFVGFFPQLVSGPIVRASQFLPQLSVPRVLANVNVRRALLLFAVGYFKKACVADNIASAIDPVFAHPSQFDGVARTLSALLYSVQIYCDFSGYTDMALGTAALLGYELAVNFEAPYFSTSVREFWQRWHISLSTWLRDYLYIPLGGNRGGRWYAARNLMLTMLLGGLWHGANWTFILWGFLHGLALVVHRFWTGFRPSSPSPSLAVRGLCWLGTFAWVVMCFTIFRCENIHVAGQFLAGRTGEPSGLSPSLDWFAVILVLGAAHWVIFRHKALLKARLEGAADWLFYPALGVASAFLLSLTPGKAAPFIYFQF